VLKKYLTATEKYPVEGIVEILLIAGYVTETLISPIYLAAGPFALM